MDDLFNEKMRMVVEYMQYRGLSSDIKRKVGGVLEESRAPSANVVELAHNRVDSMMGTTE